MRHWPILGALSLALVLTGCGKHGSSQQPTAANPTAAQNEDDENAVLNAPQFAAPIMLHLTGDGYQAEQQLAALNGVDPRNTYGAAYETTDFSPCLINEHQLFENLNPGLDGVPVDHFVLVKLLVERNVYHIHAYTLQYPNASMPGYGKANTFYCAVMTEGVIQPPPGQPPSWVHQPINVQFGQRVFQAWTFRNHYTTAIPGHGDVQIFAGTFNYTIRQDIPLGEFRSLGVGNAKAMLNPDTGKWEVVSLGLNDPQLVP